LLEDESNGGRRPGNGHAGAGPINGQRQGHDGTSRSKTVPKFALPPRKAVP
jgi:hypothetical protein